MAELTVVADENIPYVEEAFDHLGTVRTLPGSGIERSVLVDADAVLVRSVTKVDRKFLRETPVRFVGSATSGTDHVDRAYLRRRGVAFAHAPGSNADSVVEYVLAVLHLLAHRRNVSLEGRTVGVVGCGRIGSRLVRRLPALGMNVLPHDPPLAEEAERRGRSHPYVSFDRLVEGADVVTLHVPLVREGPHATDRWFDAGVIGRLASNAWLINASRGRVVESRALLRALRSGGLGAAALDVWEREPEPLPELVEACDLATPHVAGYSFDGKVAGTVAVYRALVDHFDLPEAWHYERVLALEEADPGLDVPSASLPPAAWTHRIIRQIYDVEADDRRFRRILDRPAGDRAGYFSGLRRDYPRRRAFSNFGLHADRVPASRRELVTRGLEMDLIE